MCQEAPRDPFLWLSDWCRWLIDATYNAQDARPQHAAQHACTAHPAPAAMQRWWTRSCSLSHTRSPPGCNMHQIVLRCAALGCAALHGVCRLLHAVGRTLAQPVLCDLSHCVGACMQCSRGTLFSACCLEYVTCGIANAASLHVASLHARRWMCALWRTSYRRRRLLANNPLNATRGGKGNVWSDATVTPPPPSPPNPKLHPRARAHTRTHARSFSAIVVPGTAARPDARGALWKGTGGTAERRRIFRRDRTNHKQAAAGALRRGLRWAAAAFGSGPRSSREACSASPEHRPHHRQALVGAINPCAAAFGAPPHGTAAAAARFNSAVVRRVLAIVRGNAQCCGTAQYSSTLSCR